MSRKFKGAQKRLKELALRSLLFGAGTVVGLAGTSLILAAFAAEPVPAAIPDGLNAQDPSPEEIAEEMLGDTESFYSSPGVGLRT